MLINTDNAIIKYSDKGKPFPYDKLLFATIEPYILEFKNARLDKLTDEDAARCLARIYKKMEVNGVPVLEFFKTELERPRPAHKDDEPREPHRARHLLLLR